MTTVNLLTRPSDLNHWAKLDEDLRVAWDELPWPLPVGTSADEQKVAALQSFLRTFHEVMRTSRPGERTTLELLVFQLWYGFGSCSAPVKAEDIISYFCLRARASITGPLRSVWRRLRSCGLPATMTSESLKDLLGIDHNRKSAVSLAEACPMLIQEEPASEPFLLEPPLITPSINGHPAQEETRPVEVEENDNHEDWFPAQALFAIRLATGALRAFSHFEQTVLRAYFFEGRTARGVAERMGVTPETVEQIIQKLIPPDAG